MKTPRDADYLKFVRTHPCIVSGSEHGVVAHHLRYHPHGGGMGLKPSDYRVVPINQFLHRELHDVGERAFWQKHGICPEIYVADMLKDYCELKFMLHIPRIHDYETAIPYIASVEKFIVDNKK